MNIMAFTKKKVRIAATDHINQCFYIGGKINTDRSLFRRDVLQEYTSRSKRMKHIILGAMARLLELDEEYFISQFSERAPTTVRINHYVPCPRPDLVLGFKAHSDDGVLATLLVDNDVAALQVLRDGVWYDVPTNPRTLLVNVGDFMEVSVGSYAIAIPILCEFS